MSRTALVTGGAGFIGSHLTDELLSRGYTVVVVDDMSLGKRSNLPKSDRLHIIELDARKCHTLAQLLRHFAPIDVIFNLAVVPLPASLSTPKNTFDVNVQITSTMCELVRKDIASTLVQFSSSEVYGTAEYVPMNESHPLNGRTPYAASKIASDCLVQSYGHTFGIDYSIIRPFNTIGPRQNAGSYAGIVPVTINRCLSDCSPVIHGDGSYSRDYSWVGDIVTAALRVYDCPATRGLVVNIGSGEEISVNDVVSAIIASTGGDLALVHTSDRPGDVRRLCADASRARKLIGYKPSMSFDEALDRTIEWYVGRKHD